MEVQNDIPLVTIAIPFYNAERYLSQAIESVLKQTYRNWLLLLIDDGSSDKSLEIAKEYERMDNRIKVFSDGENKNLGYRLNQIPQLVTTKYLARMDADDIMHRDRIQKQITVLEANSQIDVLGTNAYSIDEDNLVQGIRLEYTDQEFLKKVDGFIHPTIIAKTEWFKNNTYDVKAVRIEDAELWIRTSKRYNFYSLNEPLLYYREIGNQYYKKYFKALPTLSYVVKKHRFGKKILIFSFRYFMSSLRAYFYFLIGKENAMILSRNQVVFKDFNLKIYDSLLAEKSYIECSRK